MSSTKSGDSPLEWHRAHRARRSEEERANRLQQDRLRRSQHAIAKLKELTYAMRLALASLSPPEVVEEHCHKVSCQLVDTLAAFREAKLLDKMEQIDQVATVAHYRQQNDDQQEVPILVAYARQMIEIDPTNEQELATLVRDSAQAPGLLKAWDWVYILLDGLAGQQALVWKGTSLEEDSRSDEERSRSTTRRPRAEGPALEHWALAIEYSGTWHLFHKLGAAWQHRGRVRGVPKGRQEELLKAFAAEGGFLSDAAAVKLVRQTASGYDRRKILGSIKPDLSRLRKVIRTNLNITQAGLDPLPRDRQTRGWQARVAIGYAIKNDDGQLEFKLREQLSGEELPDIRA
jgi:hypothetical protein